MANINGDTGMTGAIFHHYILKIGISNELNQPLSGKTVSFRLVSASGNKNWRFPNGQITTTDNNGIASVEFDLQASSEDSFDDTAIVEAECAGQTETFTVKRAKSLSLNCDKNILSAADEEYATLTATVKDVNNLAVPYAPVVFNVYSDSSCTTLVESLGRVVTDDNGVATVDYYGKGAGDIYIKAECMNLIQTYEIEDIFYYGDSSKIKTNWNKNTSLSDRIIYYPTFEDFTEDVEVEFKFKDSVPSYFLFGFGKPVPNYVTKGMFIKHSMTSNQLGIYYSDSTTSNHDVILNSQYQQITNDTVFKISTSNINRIYWHLDDYTVAYRDTLSSSPLQLRIDDFNVSNSDFEYIKIKKL